jgi:hypothetical protein
MDYVLLVPVLVTAAALVYYVAQRLMTSEWVAPGVLWVGVVLLLPIAFFSRGCEYAGAPPPGDLESMERQGAEIGARLQSMAEEVFPGLTVSGGAEAVVEEESAKITDRVHGTGTWEIRGIGGFGTPEENGAAILRWWQSHSPGFFLDPTLGTRTELVITDWFLEDGAEAGGPRPGDDAGWLRMTVWRQEDRLEVEWNDAASLRPWWLIPALVSVPLLLVAAIALTWALARQRRIQYPVPASAGSTD